MTARRLAALGYPADIDTSSEQAFRNLIVSLEDTKIRKYTVEERGPLRDVSSKDWPAAFTAYLQALESRHARTWQADGEASRTSALDWLLGHAISLEYHDQAEELNTYAAGASSSQLSIDASSQACQQHVLRLAEKLHLNTDGLEYPAVVRAVAKAMACRLSNDAVYDSETEPSAKAKAVPLKDIPLGFTTNDPVLDEACKVLRLQHLSELRDLQTQINQIVVDAQTVTANPKTDLRLGRVGK